MKTVQVTILNSQRDTITLLNTPSGWTASTEVDDSSLRDVCSRINSQERSLDDVREILAEEFGSDWELMQ